MTGAVRVVYRPYLADPKPENVPVLGDLYDEIRRQPEPEAQRIAAALELYVHGSLNVFNHRTNVDINNRLVCFDIKELGKQLKNLGMLVIQDQVWNRVTVKSKRGQVHPVLCGRVPPSAARRGWRLECGDLETLSQMGRHPNGNHPEHQGPACPPRRSRTFLKTATSSIFSIRPAGIGKSSVSG